MSNFLLGRDSDRSTKERFAIRFEEESIICFLFSSTAHTLHRYCRKKWYIHSVVNLLPSNSFSLIRACIWWSVGLRPTMRIACLSCAVDMRPYLSCPKYSKTSRYSGNTNDWIVRENQIFSYIYVRMVINIILKIRVFEDLKEYE